MFVNYEIHIGGKQCHKQSNDLLLNAEPGDITKYRNPALELKEIKLFVEGTSARTSEGSLQK